MNRMLRMAFAAVSAVVLMTACVQESDTPYTESESLALKEWIQINRPDLVDNYQSAGGYYVDVVKLGDTSAKPISDSAKWVRFTFTGRNLAGDISLTRDEMEAYQIGTFTKFTRYVPFYRYYAGNSNTTLIEGTYLAMHNKLTLGEKYAAGKNPPFPREVEMRIGTQVVLYMPSTVVNSGNVSGNGGYEGQSGYELKAGAPFVVKMEITDTVKNPIQREGSTVDKFGADNGRVKPLPPKPNPAPSTRADDGDIIIPIVFRWENADNEVPQLYINRYFNPSDDVLGQYKYPSTYKSSFAPYDNFATLERNIRDTLINRFGKYEGLGQFSDADTIGKKGAVKIWYIGRFLDGFIFDSNIPGVRRLIYDERKTKGEALSYTAETGGLIQAFYYSIPKLYYGQWASILTISTHAYGALGSAGQSSTTTSNNDAAYIDYYNNVNNYFGSNGAYGGYGNGYYDNYMYGAYSGYNSSTVTTSSKTSISTEIPPYTPLLFDIYIEPKAK